jgi:hypothetical protein
MGDNVITYIKGTAVRTLPMFIQYKYPTFYAEWLKRLPEESHKIFVSQIYPTDWLDLGYAAVVPTRVLADVLGMEPEQVAYDVGKYSGEYALKGVYKVFVSISSVSFLIKRANNIVSTYYKPVETKVERPADRQVNFYFGKLLPENQLIVHRIRGWIYQLVFFTQKTEPIVDLELITDSDNFITGKFIIKW